MADIISGVFNTQNTSAKKENGREKPIPNYIFQISLSFSDPLIWRRVQVPGTLSLTGLHLVIQRCMGWSDSHVHQFLVGKISFEPTLRAGKIRELTEYSESKFKLYELEEGMSFIFTYVYDAGDGWEHEIRLEETVTPERAVNSPVLLSGERACPPETTSDIHEYQAILDSPDHHDKLFELTGEHNFDPELFDLAAAKRRLKSTP